MFTFALCNKALDKQRSCLSPTLKLFPPNPTEASRFPGIRDTRSFICVFSRAFQMSQSVCRWKGSKLDLKNKID